MIVSESSARINFLSLALRRVSWGTILLAASQRWPLEQLQKPAQSRAANVLPLASQHSIAACLRTVMLNSRPMTKDECEWVEAQESFLVYISPFPRNTGSE
jgi:hypothetical protein